MSRTSSNMFVFLCLLSDYLFKLLLIGDSGVGKSCLLLRFAVSFPWMNHIFWKVILLWFLTGLNKCIFNLRIDNGPVAGWCHWAETGRVADNSILHVLCSSKKFKSSCELFDILETPLWTLSSPNRHSPFTFSNFVTCGGFCPWKVEQDVNRISEPSPWFYFSAGWYIHRKLH